ncbi:Ricin B lectin [Actinobacteria bacterium OK074]|nr:Ricin B lectin [Actinobacteria bacterium OK074]
MPPGESDESLAARLGDRQEGAGTYPVALLTARHWQPVHDYAVVCLASPSDAATLVTATVFHQVLDRLARSGSAAALRPELLVAVRDTVREWAADGRITGVLPELRKPAGGRGMRTAKSLTPENRALAGRSFQALPGLARCLLWHTEVEAEPISIPAGLSGMDSATAAAALEQAREQFRQGCVRAHRELAPTKECRFYNRLLDVPIRRGGALLPDVQRHLLECRYCRNAAEQLGHFEGGLGVLLAEAVLGWGARRYLESRPGRLPVGERPRGTSGPGGPRPVGAGRHRLLDRVPAPRRRGLPVERDTRALLTGVGIASAAVLATLLVVGLWSDNGGGVDPAASTSAAGADPAASGSGARTSPSPSTPTAPATGPQQTRLRNAAADLCLDIPGKVKSGAGVGLAVCSSAWTQKWTYEEDGLLRSGADPKLCLDSGAKDGVLALGGCASAKSERGDDVRYDLTVRGELLPRRKESLAVTPASDDPDADVVVKNRDGSDSQLWLTDGQVTESESLSIEGAWQLPGTPAVDRPEAGAVREETGL